MHVHDAASCVQSWPRTVAHASVSMDSVHGGMRCSWKQVFQCFIQAITCFSHRFVRVSFAPETSLSTNGATRIEKWPTPTFVASPLLAHIQGLLARLRKVSPHRQHGLLQLQTILPEASFEPPLHGACSSNHPCRCAELDALVMENVLANPNFLATSLRDACGEPTCISVSIPGKGKIFSDTAKLSMQLANT